jgi:DNA polymerase III alpha subunit
MDMEEKHNQVLNLHEALQELKELREQYSHQLEEERRLSKEENARNAEELHRLTSLVEQAINQTTKLTERVNTLKETNAALIEQLKNRRKKG